jgi:hypothetical protein
MIPGAGLDGSWRRYCTLAVALRCLRGHLCQPETEEGRCLLDHPPMIKSLVKFELCIRIYLMIRYDTR